MSWIRSEFRRKAEDLDFDTFGQNFKNWIGGSAVNAADGPLVHGGGFVMGSFSVGTSGAGFLLLSAADFLYSTYGATIASNLLGGGTGFKVIPFAFLDFSGDTNSACVFYQLSASNAMSTDDSIVAIRVNAFRSGPAPIIVGASTVGVHFQAFGWVVSAPTGFN